MIFTSFTKDKLIIAFKILEKQTMVKNVRPLVDPMDYLRTDIGAIPKIHGTFVT